MRIFYTLVFTLAIPFILLRLLWRGMRAPAYFKRWQERFALQRVDTPTKPVIWVHAVSVGETEASGPLVDSLQRQYPNHHILVTTMTPTGSARVTKRYGNTVSHCYLPYDLPFAIKRFFQQWQPSLGIIMETELWPNLLHYSQQAQIPMVLANARLSARSAAGYQRISKLTKTMLQSFQLIATQTANDKQRLLALGADESSVHHVGNLKFEISLPASTAEQAEALRNLWQDRPVFIAASTHEGEDEIILSACHQIRRHIPDLLLLLVPRHPERFERVAILSQKAGFNTMRRSDNQICRPETDVFVIDSMGELPLFYGTSDVAFVGGSLVPVGGHNLLEPAALGRAVLVGPHYFNFLEVTRQFLAADAAIEVHNDTQLAKAVVDLLQSPQKRAAMGEAGLLLIKQSQGASDRLLTLISALIDV